MFGPGLVLAAAVTAHAAFQAYVRGYCAAVFGCAGGVQLAAAIGGLALLGSSAALCVVAWLRRRIVCGMPWRRLATLIGALAALQIGLLATVPLWPTESIGTMLAAWSIACGVAGWGGLHLASPRARGERPPIAP